MGERTESSRRYRESVLADPIRHQARKDYIRSYYKEYRKKNREKVRSYEVKYDEKNLPVRRSKQAESKRDNRPLIRITEREYYRRNRDKVLAKNQRRRARLYGAEGSFSHQDVKNLYEKQNGKCSICLVLFGKYHIDHIKPLFKGGSNWPSNLQLLCPSCNCRKGHK